MSHDPLPILLRSLRLSAMAEVYDGAIQRAEALRMRLFLDRANTRQPRPIIKL